MNKDGIFHVVVDSIPLPEILRDGNITYGRALQFNSKTPEAAFLFDESVQNIIDKMLYPSNGSGLPIGDERSQIVKENEELLKWHSNELKEIKSFFAKKLALSVS